MTDATMTDIAETRGRAAANLAFSPTHRTRLGPTYPSRTGRPVGFALVVLLHAGLITLLFLSIGTQRIAVGPKALEVRAIEDIKPPPPDAPPPPPPPAAPLAPPPPFIPLPEITVATPPSAAPTVAVATTTPAPAPAPAAPPATPAKRALPDIDLRHSSDPLYPPESRRRAEQGLVVLLVLVEADGQPSEIRLEQSSGHDRLDQAAIDGAKHNLRYIAGTVDGKAERMWLRYRYNFQLR